MEESAGIRINKYLSEHGICSRREADRLLSEGRVTINGTVAAAGQRVLDMDTVTVDGENVGEQKDEPVLLAFNKPGGIVCSTSSKDRAQNIIEFINYKCRIFPIGRLDKDSEGLILLTNRGELVNAVNRARGGHEKEYEVRCMDRISDSFIRKMSEGVEINIPTGEAEPVSGKKLFRRVTTNKCRVRRLDERSFNIVLTQGYNRQIRRMTAALGNKVIELKRIRIMNIELGELAKGGYRIVSGRELLRFEQLLADENNKNNALKEETDL